MFHHFLVHSAIVSAPAIAIAESECISIAIEVCNIVDRLCSLKIVTFFVQLTENALFDVGTGTKLTKVMRSFWCLFKFKLTI
jgi:hypothetical protein